MPMLNAASASHVRSGSVMRAGHLALEIGQVLGRGDRRRFCVQPVCDAQVARRVLRQLHQAAGSRFAGGDRVPLRFLVGERRQQPPFDAALRLRLDERPAPLRQRLVDPVLEYAGVDPLDLARIAEIAVGKAPERAVLAQPRNERVERVAQLRIPGRDRPGELARGSGREGHVEVEVDVAGHRGVAGRDDRVVGGAVRNLRDQRVGRDDVDRLPMHLRMRPRGSRSAARRSRYAPRRQPWRCSDRPSAGACSRRRCRSGPARRRGNRCSRRSQGRRPDRDCGRRPRHPQTGRPHRVGLAPGRVWSSRAAAPSANDTWSGTPRSCAKRVSRSWSNPVVSPLGPVNQVAGPGRTMTLIARIGPRRRGRLLAAAEQQQCGARQPDHRSSARQAKRRANARSRMTLTTPRCRVRPRRFAAIYAAVRWRSLATGCEGSTEVVADAASRHKRRRYYNPYPHMAN